MNKTFGIFLSTILAFLLGAGTLQARYYNPDTGRFWTMDTYEGDQEDPLSLHTVNTWTLQIIPSTTATPLETQ